MAEETAAVEAPAPTPAPETTPPTTETPKAEGTLAGQAGEPAAETPAEAAAQPEPVDYGKLSLPEGFVADEVALGKFREIAGANKLPLEAAQQMIALYAEQKQAEAGAWARTVDGWTKATKSDPYLTGQALAEGGFSSFDEARAAAAKAQDRFADKEFRDLVNDPELGLGNHPAVVRFLAKVGREFREPALAEGIASSPATRKEVLDQRFPSMRTD